MVNKALFLGGSGIGGAARIPLKHCNKFTPCNVMPVILVDCILVISLISKNFDSTFTA